MGDVEAIHAMVNRQANQGRMLARSRLELYENLRDFFVAADRRRLHGAAALHFSWQGLAEIKSVAVLEGSRRQGVGTSLVRACLREAAKLEVDRVFVLTYVPEFFEARGFRPVDRNELPHRIWAECVRCPQFPDCGESAMVKDIPKPGRGRRQRARRGPPPAGKSRTT
jgi:amino-acid N-acetyltransferase